ncbi:MAG: hypothetical protein HYR85_11945 [Planctomycetes bacterium]|nr:hypothetical protein [Planctomycetota bacterium]MBI3843931.1 hypothetical protein [Planctomycetota bacterium]
MSSFRDLDPAREARFWAGIDFADQFFDGTSTVHRALDKLVRLLDEDHIPYLVVGGMALNHFGYVHVTTGVDVILTREGLSLFRQRHLGDGYVEKSPGSKSVRDIENDVVIGVLLSGDYPVDGEPRAVTFPDPSPSDASQGSVRFLVLPKLIELKLASGMTAPHRLKDLADVIEIVYVRKLSEDFADQLDPMVRDKYRELWKAAQTRDPE